MSEDTTETIDVPEPEMPSEEEIEQRMLSREEIEQRMVELDENGVTKEAPCIDCDSLTEITVLPGESTEGAICRSCTVKTPRELE